MRTRMSRKKCNPESEKYKLKSYLRADKETKEVRKVKLS